MTSPVYIFALSSLKRNGAPRDEFSWLALDVSQTLEGSVQNIRIISVQELA
jgi:hypothetical protein